VIAYLESSAAAKLLTHESEQDGVIDYLNAVVDDGGRVISTSLLETELRRAAGRFGLVQTAVTDILDRVDVYDLTRSTFTYAGILPGANLGSLDALHIAAARLLGADILVSYDKRQITAAEDVGLRTHSPA
jgi:predicted nucleic acid-binding protein